MAEITRPGPLAGLLGEPSENSQVQIELIEAPEKITEKIYGSYPYAELNKKHRRSNSPC
jgi:hypothetical protein